PVVAATALRAVHRSRGLPDGSQHVPWIEEARRATRSPVGSASGGGMTDSTPDYSLLDQIGASASMFYPRPEAYPPPEGATDVVIDVAPGVHVGTRFYAFDRGFPTVLYFHGNGEIASDHDDIALFYRDIELNLFVAEFRGYGRSNGTPTAAALVADAHP